jgi:uncharacterized protein (TIGR02996 family)
MPGFYDEYLGENAGVQPAAPAASGGGGGFYESYLGEHEVAPDEYARRAKQAGINVGRTPEEHAAYLKESGKFSRQGAQALTSEFTLDTARKKYEGDVPGGTFTQFGRNFMPFGDLLDNKRYKETHAAKQRLAAGQAKPEDYDLIARQERLDQIDRQMGESTGTAMLQGFGSVSKLFLEGAAAGKALSLAGKVVPGAAGRFLTGEAGMARAGVGDVGPVLTHPSVLKRFGVHAGRMALLTAGAPAFYLDEARQRNVEAGRDPDDIRGFPGSFLHGYSNMLVLGSVAKVVRAGTGATALGRVGRGVGVGVGEQAIADAVGGGWDKLVSDTWKTRTEFGVLGDIFDGKLGEAAHKLAVQAVTFGAFAGLHEVGLRLDRKEAHRVAESKLNEAVEKAFGKDFAADVQKAMKAGLSREEAIKRVSEKRLQALETETKAEVEKAEPRPLAERLAEAPGRIDAALKGGSLPERLDAGVRRIDEALANGLPERLAAAPGRIDAALNGVPGRAPGSGARPKGQRTLTLGQLDAAKAAVDKAVVDGTDPYEAFRNSLPKGHVETDAFVNALVGRWIGVPERAPGISPDSPDSPAKSGETGSGELPGVPPVHPRSTGGTPPVQPTPQSPTIAPVGPKPGVGDSPSQPPIVDPGARQGPVSPPAGPDGTVPAPQSATAQVQTDVPLTPAQQARQDALALHQHVVANPDYATARPGWIVQDLASRMGVKPEDVAQVLEFIPEAIFEKAIEASPLPAAEKATILEGVKESLDGLPAEHRILLAREMRGVEFFADSNSLKAALSEADRKKCEGYQVGGFFRRSDSTVLVDGIKGLAELTGAGPKNVRQVVMHEVGHAMARAKGELDMMPEWSAAAAAETAPKDGVYPLSDYAYKSAHDKVSEKFFEGMRTYVEAFAEFYRLLHGTTVPTGEIARKFPLMSKVFVDAGLWPAAERKAGLKGAQRRLDDIFGKSITVDGGHVDTIKKAAEPKAAEPKAAEPKAGARASTEMTPGQKAFLDDIRGAFDYEIERSIDRIKGLDTEEALAIKGMFAGLSPSGKKMSEGLGLSRQGSSDVAERALAKLLEADPITARVLDKLMTRVPAGREKLSEGKSRKYGSRRAGLKDVEGEDDGSFARLPDEPMSESERAMLEAVQADPLDRTRRLVMADAIEEGESPNAGRRAAGIRRDVDDPPSERGVSDVRQTSVRQRHDMLGSQRFHEIEQEEVKRLREERNYMDPELRADAEEAAQVRYLAEREAAGERLEFELPPDPDRAFPEMEVRPVREFGPRLHQFDTIDAAIGIALGRTQPHHAMTNFQHPLDEVLGGPRDADIEYATDGLSSRANLVRNHGWRGEYDRGYVRLSLAEVDGERPDIAKGILSITFHSDAYYPDSPNRGARVHRLLEEGWRLVELGKGLMRIDSPLRQRLRSEQARGLRTGEPQFMRFPDEPMSETERGMLEAVQADPLDKTRRLAMADAIEEGESPNAGRRAAGIRRDVDDPPSERGVSGWRQLADNSGRVGKMQHGTPEDRERYYRFAREVEEEGELRPGSLEYSEEVYRRWFNQYEADLGRQEFKTPDYVAEPHRWINQSHDLAEFDTRLYHFGGAGDALSLVDAQGMRDNIMLPLTVMTRERLEDLRKQGHKGVEIEYLPSRASPVRGFLEPSTVDNYRRNSVEINFSAAGDPARHLREAVLSLTFDKGISDQSSWTTREVDRLTDAGWKKVWLPDGRMRLDSPMRQRLRSEQARGLRTGEPQFMMLSDLGDAIKAGAEKVKAGVRSGTTQEKFKDLWNRFLTGPGGKPDDLHHQDVAKNNRIRADAQQVQDAAKDLEKALGVGWADVPEAMKEQMYRSRFFPEVMAALAPVVREPLQRMWRHVDLLQQRLIEEGVLDSELVVKIGAGGPYLTRQYMAFIDPEWHRKVKPEVVNRFKVWHAQEVERAVAKGEAPRELFPDEIDGIVNSLLRGNAGKEWINVLRSRKDLPMELSELLGEVRDPLGAYAYTVAHQSRLLSNAVFMRNIKDLGVEQGWLSQDRSSEGWKEVGEKEGPLKYMQGYYSTPEIADAIKGMFGPRPEGSPLLKGYMKLLGLFKYAKTVGSPISHVRQALGNLMFIARNGYTTEHLRLAKEKLKLLYEDKEAGRDYYQELILGNVAESGIHVSEMREVAHDALGVRDPFELPSALADKGVARLLRKGADFGQKLYRWEDLVPKIVAYEAEKGHFRKANPGWTEAQVRDAAAKLANKLFPTHTHVSPAIQALRRFPLVGPFVSFSSEVVRTTYHTARQAWTEMHDANPETRKVGTRRMAGLVSSLAAFAAVGALSRLAAGVTLDEEDAMRRLLPEWNRDGQLLHLGKDANGRRMVVDLGRTDPHSVLWEPVQAAITGARSGTGTPFDVLEAAARPYIAEELGTRAFLDVARNRMEKGGGEGKGQVYNPESPFYAKAGQVLGHVGKAMEPGISDQFWRTGGAVTGLRGTNSKVRSPEEELLADFTGQRVAGVDPKESMRFSGRTFRERMGNAERELNRIVSEAGRAGTKLTPEQVRDQAERGEEMRRGVFEDLIADVHAARMLGLSDAEIAKELKEGGVSREAVQAVMAGKAAPRNVGEVLRR